MRARPYARVIFSGGVLSWVYESGLANFCQRLSLKRADSKGPRPLALGSGMRNPRCKKYRGEPSRRSREKFLGFGLNSNTNWSKVDVMAGLLMPTDWFGSDVTELVSESILNDVALFWAKSGSS